jgi:hypothetical protein
MEDAFIVVRTTVDCNVGVAEDIMKLFKKISHNYVTTTQNFISLNKYEPDKLAIIYTIPENVA